MSEVSVPSSREASLDVAKSVCEGMRVPPGFRVVATDEGGAFVGVASNTEAHDVERILHAALFGAERVSHR